MAGEASSWAAIISAGVAAATAAANIAYGYFNTRRQSEITYKLQKSFAEFQEQQKGRAEAQQKARKSAAEVIELLIISVESIQEFRDKLAYILRNAGFESLDSASAVAQLEKARSSIESAYSGLAARADIAAIKPLHATKRSAVDIEADIRTALRNSRTIPSLGEETRSALTKRIDEFAESQAGLRDLIQRKQLEITRELFP